MNKMRLLAAGVLACAILQLPAPSEAFIPGGLKAVATGGKSHKVITEEGLDAIYADYSFGRLGTKPLTKPMKEAREAMADANADVDDKEPTQTASHCDAEQLQACSNRIRDRLQEAVDLLKNSDDVINARIKVGNALHTLQDFYSHSNWIELGNTGAHPQLGKITGSNVIANVAPPTAATCTDAPLLNLCYEENITTSFLTSGFFGGQDKTNTSATKCRHGGSFDSGFGARGGINKDSSTCFIAIGPAIVGISPHEDQNGPATTAAIAATEQALRDVKAKLNDERKFKALLGIGTSLGFAIDTTGSMGSVIAGVRATATSIVNSRLGTDEEPTQYVVSAFNDPFVGPVTSTDDPNEAKAAINALFASGGGDCPELAMRGALLAVSAMQEGGTLFGFTDASAKDAAAEPEVNSLAVDKNIKVSWSLFGSCSPYDPAYFKLANQTGGQVFILSRAEAGAITQLADFLTRSSAVDILSVAGTLAAAATVHTFPVDTQTSRITVSVALSESAVISVIRPDGTPVLAGQPGVTQVPVASARIFSIDAPQVGQWRVSIQGTGDYSVAVNGESKLAFDKFKFVRQGGRPGHEGYYPIEGYPVVGKTYPVIGKLSGIAQNLLFQLRTRGGEVLQSFALASPEADAGELLGNLTAGAQSFVVYAVGTDSNGTAFQRVIATQITPQPISIVAPIAVQLGRGQTTTYIFQVKNDGSADSFAFTALDNRGYVTGISPASGVIPAGGTLNVRVTLAPPPTTPVGTSDTLTLIAKSTTRPDVRNFAVLASTVVERVLEGDVNRDGVVNCDDLGLVKASFGSRVGQPAFNPNVDLDTNAIVDVRDLALVARKVPAGTVCN